MSIQWVIDKNIELINGETLKKLDRDQSNDSNPNQPSLIINYNLRDDMNYVKKYMNQLWKSTYNSIEIAEMSSIKKLDDLTAIINKLRGNTRFNSYVTIYIHLLYNATTASVEELMEKINSLFYDKTTYVVIVHAFFDMTLEDNKNCIYKLNNLLNQEEIEYKFIYQNQLQNNALLINENRYRIFRLMSNVIALMINADKLDLFAENKGVHTFSYTLLEKPVKKIVQIVIKELLTDECLNKYEREGEFERNVTKIILKSVIDETNKLAKHYYFKKNDFQYLPNNKELTTKVANLDSVKSNYPLLYSCYEEMIEERKKIYKDIEFQDDLEKCEFRELKKYLNYNNLLAYLNSGKKLEDLTKSAESILLTKTNIDGKKDILSLLLDDANNLIDLFVREKLFKCLNKEMGVIKNRAIMINEIINKIRKDVALTDVYQGNNEINLINYYESVASYFYKNNRDEIIEIMNKSIDEESFIENLDKIVKTMFDKNTVFYQTFEDEINARVGTEKNVQELFNAIIEEESMNNNICLYSQADYLVEPKKNILLMNESSKLEYNKENFQCYKMNQQDCIELINICDIEKR